MIWFIVVWVCRASAASTGGGAACERVDRLRAGAGSSAAHAAYQRRAWNVSADDVRDIFEWAVVGNLTGPYGPAMRGVYERSQYARVLDASATLGKAKGACGTVARLGSALEEAAGPHGAVAIGFWSRGHGPLKYGHFFEYALGVYCRLVRPRLLARPAPRRTIRVYVPAGTSRCSAEFAELEVLFAGPLARAASRLELVRAPWVPSCVQSVCTQFGGVPAALRGRVTLLADFAPGPRALPRSAHELFRRHVTADALASEAAAAGAAARRPLALYVRTRRLPTRRTVRAEAQLEGALRAFVEAEHPELEFVAADVHELPYAREVSLFARTHLLVSLWGSSLQNCRFMPARALVLELYGALVRQYGDSALYGSLCALGCGLRHVSYFVPGAVPGRGPNGTGRVRFDVPSDMHTARVEPARVIGLLRRVLPAGPCARADWAGVYGEFDAALTANVHPFTHKRLPAVGRQVLRAPQYHDETATAEACRQPPGGVGTPASLGARALSHAD